MARFPQNQAALARAVELAHAHNARLTIVHIADELGTQGARGLDATERHLLEEQALKAARERVADAIRTHDIGRIAVDIRVEAGSPSSRVVEISNDLAVDPIAVGPYEHGVIRLALLGSVTQRLRREAACDVLISRPPPAAV